jgi:transposase InsO family protein
VARVLDRLALSRGLPKIIRSDNGKEICGKAMLEWAQRRGVQIRRIEPSKPNQNAYIESVNGRLRDECLNEHWFPNLLQASAEIETWRREYKEKRPKKNPRWDDPRGLCEAPHRGSATVTPDSRQRRY